MTETLERARQQFEKWCQSLPHEWGSLPLTHSWVRGVETDSYNHGQTALSWIAWQAGAASVAEECAKIIEDSPLGYRTEDEHGKLEAFADKVSAKIRSRYGLTEKESEK